MWRLRFSRLLSAGRRLSATAAAVAFPPRCVLCSRELPSLEVVCSRCAEALPSLPAPRCRRCGEAVEDASIDLCLRCGTRHHFADRIFSLGPYRGQWGELVRALKFEREIAVGRWLGARMAELLIAVGLDRNVDAVTYVPMTRRDRLRRGFNHAEVLARGIARKLDLPLVRTLRKARSTPLQSRLSAVERGRNLRGAFRRLPSTQEHVLLVDDIYTTGATVEECARTLKDGGTQSVVAVTVARA